MASTAVVAARFIHSGVPPKYLFTSVRASDAGLWEAFVLCVSVIKLMAGYHEGHSYKEAFVFTLGQKTGINRFSGPG